jgi:16S rRNA (cytosine1402-N4)-methyltransferase
MKHIPVLKDEVKKFLNLKNGDFLIDGTLDGGGHAMSLINELGPEGIFLGVDLDESLVNKFKIEFGDYLKKHLKKFFIINENYANLENILKRNNLPKAQGLLIDLGFSMWQIDSGRGFTFLKNEILDMRYSQKLNNVVAMGVINKLSENELAEIFYKYGGERKSRQIAKLIVRERKIKPIETTGELVRIIEMVKRRRGKSHPATKIFQALRIFVNSEIENLTKILNSLDKVVGSDGRAVFITFHSLEDKIVKNGFKKMAEKGIAEILTKKPITPTRDEVLNNPRSRSAKLRALKML